VQPKVKRDVIEELNVPVNAASASTKERLAREKDEANVALNEEWDDIQAKIKADHELAKDCKQRSKKSYLLKKKQNYFNNS
ncbi:hypothetical protein Tco_0043542, partial [Tanacetum coccineum]